MLRVGGRRPQFSETWRNFSANLIPGIGNVGLPSCETPSAAKMCSFLVGARCFSAKKLINEVDKVAPSAKQSEHALLKSDAPLSHRILFSLTLVAHPWHDLRIGPVASLTLWNYIRYYSQGEDYSPTLRISLIYSRAYGLAGSQLFIHGAFLRPASDERTKHNDIEIGNVDREIKGFLRETLTENWPGLRFLGEPHKYHIFWHYQWMSHGRHLKMGLREFFESVVNFVRQFCLDFGLHEGIPYTVREALDKLEQKMGFKCEIRGNTVEGHFMINGKYIYFPKIIEDVYLCSDRKFVQIDCIKRVSGDITSMDDTIYLPHVDLHRQKFAGKLELLYVRGDVYHDILIYENEARKKWRVSWFREAKEETTSFMILDALDCQKYLSGRIGGRIGVLVISEHMGAFEMDCATRIHTHVQFAKSFRLPWLLVVVDMMGSMISLKDKERFNYISRELKSILRQYAYAMNDYKILPISSSKGLNTNHRVNKEECPWWKGECLDEVLDNLDAPFRDQDGRLRMSIINNVKDEGTIVGKIESGTVHVGDSLLLMPSEKQVEVLAVFRGRLSVDAAVAGERLWHVKLAGIAENDIRRGYFLCGKAKPISVASVFTAQLWILESINGASICVGYNVKLHIHCVVEDCNIKFTKELDRNTHSLVRMKPLYVGEGACIICCIQVKNSICIERYLSFAHLGRFSLYAEGKCMAIGKVLGLEA